MFALFCGVEETGMRAGGAPSRLRPSSSSLQSLFFRAAALPTPNTQHAMNPKSPGDPTCTHKGPSPPPSSCHVTLCSPSPTPMHTVWVAKGPVSVQASVVLRCGRRRTYKVPSCTRISQPSATSLIRAFEPRKLKPKLDRLTGGAHASLRNSVFSARQGCREQRTKQEPIWLGTRPDVP